MEDGSIDTLGDIGSVLARSAFVRSSRETDLVVYDDVDGTSDGVVGERLHLELLVNDTLTGHRGITMHNDGAHCLSVLDCATERMLLSACSSHDDGVDGLQVGWIGKKCHSNLGSSAVTLNMLSSVACTQVIFNITCILELTVVSAFG